MAAALPERRRCRFGLSRALCCALLRLMAQPVTKHAVRGRRRPFSDFLPCRTLFFPFMPFDKIRQFFFFFSSSSSCRPHLFCKSEKSVSTRYRTARPAPSIGVRCRAARFHASEAAKRTCPAFSCGEQRRFFSAHGLDPRFSSARDAELLFPPPMLQKTMEPSNTLSAR